MNKLIPLLLAMLMVISFSVYAQEFRRAGEAPDQLNGNPYYVLPKAALLIQVPVTTSVYKLSSKAKSENGWKNYRNQLTKRFGVDLDIMDKLMNATGNSFQTASAADDSIKVLVTAKPDLSKIFYTDAARKWNKNKSVLFNYGGDGILTDGESFIEDKTFDLAIKSIGAITSIAGLVAKGGDGDDKVIDDNGKKVDDPFVELQNVLDKIQDLHTQASDKDIYKEVKSSLEKKYATLFAEYFYSEKKKVKTYKTTYTPDKNSVKGENQEFVPLFAVDTVTGKLTFTDKVQKELWGSELIVGPIDDKKPYKYKFIDIQDNILNHLDAKKMPSNGFAFNIPAQNEFKLINADSKTIFDGIVKIPQFGIVGRVNSKKNKLVYSLDPVSGELKKLSVGSTGLTSDQIGAVGTTTSEVIKTIKGDSSDTELENEVKRLENEKKKRDLLKELNP